jgi:hypothetical protein
MTFRKNSDESSRPIFLHSSFRTGSTWLWSKFRNNPACYCYYEIFNEMLEDINFKNILQSPSTWNSHHPAGAPYFSEFSPLLKKVKGIEGFDQEMAFSDFFLELNGDRDRVNKTSAYLASLVNLAQQNRRVPVLSCTRSIARVEMIKSQIGGTHIFIKRSLLNQWFSYSNQSQNCNPYFFNTILKTLNSKDQKDFLLNIRSFLTENISGGAYSKDDHDILLIGFLCIHIYMNFRYKDHFDIKMDFSNSPSKSDLEIAERMIMDHTSLRVDLSDYSDIISAPQRLIGDIDRVVSMVRSLFAQGIDGTNDDMLRLAVDSELAAFQEGYEQYRRIAGSAHLQLEMGDVAHRHLQERFNAVTDELNETQSAANRQAEELAARINTASDDLQNSVLRLQEAERDLQAERALHQSLTDQLAQAMGRIETLEQELAQSQAHYGALERRYAESEQGGTSVAVEMQAVQERCSALELDVQQATRNAQALSAQLEVAEADKQAQHCSLTDQMAHAMEWIQTLEKALEKSHADYGALDRRYAESEQARLSIAAEMQAAQERCSALDHGVQQAASRVRALSDQLEAAEADKQAHHQSLTNQLAQAMGRIQKLEKALEQSQAHYSALERRYAASEQGRISIAAEMQAAQERCSALEFDVQNASNALEQQRVDMHQLLAEIDFISSGRAKEHDAFERRWLSMIKKIDANSLKR